MRLESIHIHNYRLYHDFKLDFSKNDKDVQIIVGDNGVGKTTFLNAINWCLYGDEPHAFNKETSLPILNLDASEDDVAFVELTISGDDGQKIIFKRTHGKLYNDDLDVSIKNKYGETFYYRSPEADYQVEGFVPAAIREFFFFDGEQLDNYFLSDRTKNIENRIFILSHIDVLDQMIERLNEKFKKFNRESGKLNKDIEPLTIDLEKKHKALSQEQERKEKLDSSINHAKKRIKELDDELIGIPDVRVLEEKRKGLKEKVDKIEDNCNQIKSKINQLLLSTAPSVFAYDAIKYTLDDIDEKNKSQQLPPEIDEDVVGESIKEGVCKLCNRALDEESLAYLNNALTEYTLSTKQSKLLLDLKSPLKLHENNIEVYSKRRKDLNNNLKIQEENLERYSKELNIVNGQYAGYKDESIKNKFEERENLENSRDSNLLLSGAADNNIEKLNKDIEDINKEIDKILSNNEKTSIIKKKKQLCADSLELLTTTKNDIMVSTKKQIGDFTKDKFFNLIWKKDTFSDVTIDDTYNVELIHTRTNANCIGTASAAERELLALAFTLGIHSVSGFDSPILIDTPLARVSGDHRVNFTNVLLEISKKKQTILILTPDEFSQDVRDLIYDEEIQKFGIFQVNEFYSDIKEMSANIIEETYFNKEDN